MRSGPVVSSLAQVIEELVLNSADAGASVVECDVFPGEASVLVADNGSGMTLAELKAVANRHSTSKAGKEGRPHGSAMGFRGEALASLAYLGHVEITARDPSTGKTWTRVVQRPHVDEVFPASRPRAAGTLVAVRQLFARMPVRRGRLAPAAAEQAAAAKVLQRAALALPHIATELRVDGTTRSAFRACSSRREAAAQVFGEEAASHLRRVSASSGCGRFRVSGYVGLARPASDGVYVFVNARYCKRVPRLAAALRRATASYCARAGPDATVVVSSLPRGRPPRFPAPPEAEVRRLREASGVPSAVGPERSCLLAVLDVRCHPARYDVGFDPDKTVIEFDDWDAVTATLEAAVDAYMLGVTDRQVRVAPPEACSEDQPPTPSAVAAPPTPVLPARSRAAVVTPAARRPRSEAATPGSLDSLLLWASRHPEPSATPSSSVRGTDRPKRRRGLDSGVGSDLTPAQPSTRRARQALVVLPPSLPAAEPAAAGRAMTGTRATLVPLPRRRGRAAGTSWLRPGAAPRACGGIAALAAPGVGYASDTGPLLREAPIGAGRVLVSADGASVSRQQLASSTVLGQLDDKFVLVSAAVPGAPGRRVLLCLDQHAADERVRVEAIDADVLGSASRFRRASDAPAPDLPGVRSRALDRPVEIPLTAAEAAGLEASRPEARRWGWEYRCLDGPRRAMLLAAPEVLGRRMGGAELLAFARRLEEAEAGRSRVRPLGVVRAINSAACRGAVMFGDRLTAEQCGALVGGVSRARLPFQCAHGRPSVLPLAILE